MLVHLSIAFTENSIHWTYNICGLNHQYPITTLGFTSFYNNMLNSVHSISPFHIIHIDWFQITSTQKDPLDPLIM